MLVAISAGFVAFFVINRLPRLYDPVDECDAMRRATRDRWFLQVRSDDPAMLDARPSPARRAAPGRRSHEMAE